MNPISTLYLLWINHILYSVSFLPLVGIAKCREKWDGRRTVSNQTFDASAEGHLPDSCPGSCSNLSLLSCGSPFIVLWRQRLGLWVSQPSNAPLFPHPPHALLRAPGHDLRQGVRGRGLHISFTSKYCVFPLIFIENICNIDNGYSNRKWLVVYNLVNNFLLDHCIKSNMDRIFIFQRIISNNHSFDTKIQISAKKKSVERTVAFSFHFKYIDICITLRGGAIKTCLDNDGQLQFAIQYSSDHRDPYPLHIRSQFSTILEHNKYNFFFRVWSRRPGEKALTFKAANN